MYCNLKSLRVDLGNLKNNDFAPKELAKQSQPNWPGLLKFVTLSPTEINMRKTNLVSLKDALLI